MDGKYAGFAGAKACREKSELIEALFIINKFKKPIITSGSKKSPAIARLRGILSGSTRR
jgi:hypothetical protein